MLQQLLSVYPEAGYRASFKGMLLGGGPIAPDKLAQCEEKGIPVIQSYGMTETCSQVVALKFEDEVKFPRLAFLAVLVLVHQQF
jgi:O-succinylbenzoic acid--CoA ligase